MSGRSVAMGLAVALIAGASGWFGAQALRSEDPTARSEPGETTADTIDPELATLRREIEKIRGDLDAERRARTALEAQVAGLVTELDAPTELAAVESPAVEAPEKTSPRPARPVNRGRWLDKDTLSDSGLGETEIEEIGASFAAIEMERLELEDQATREGWKKSRRYTLARNALTQSIETLRDEYGDSRYDWILYAARRPNRVVVQDVLDDSPARDAGLEPGDTVLNYAGERIFEQHTLIRATQSGEKGETVKVEILREGRAETIYVPRGPLGVRISPQTQRPEPIR